MVPFELEAGFLEVDDGVEEGEDVGAEVGDVLHGVVMGVEDGEEVVHPGGVDEGPSHDWEEGDLDGVSDCLLTC